MEALFLKLVNMSITASWLVLAVLIFRVVLKKAPKYIRVILWGLVGLRLVLPFSIESILSLIPSNETLPQEFLYAATPQINSGIPAVNNALNPVIAGSLTPVGLTSANPTQIWSFIFSRLWLIGVILMGIYALVSYLIVRRKVSAFIPVGKNIRLCDHIDTPFILGIFSPKIYLPSSLDQATADHVLAHEQAHLTRRDHWWKPLGFALLAVYWFNPVMWLAYILLCRDIEMACDERVVKELGSDEKKAYSTALLSCSMPRRMIAACPLAFGEVGVKSRIKSVLNYKKPAFWIIVVAVIACIVVAVCFLTDPEDRNTPYSVTSTLSADEVEFAQVTIWGDETEHILLSEDQVQKLVETINSLKANEFVQSKVPEHDVSLMIKCGGKEILLQSDGDYVQFIFDSATAESIDENWCYVSSKTLNSFITEIRTVTINRLAVGIYTPVECVYMNSLSSYYPGNLSEEYTYLVTEEGFYTYSKYFICNANEDNVNWGWKTMAQSAKDLLFYIQWLESDWSNGFGLELNEGMLYQKLNSQQHLILDGDTLYMIHGGENQKEPELVWGIYRLEPTVAATTEETALDTAIRQAILEKNSASGGSLGFESHVILSHMIGCGAESVDGGPVGCTQVRVLAMIWRPQYSFTEISQQLVLAELSFDEFADGSYALSDYWQYEGTIDRTKSVRDYFEDVIFDTETVESFVPGLFNGCMEQAKAYSDQVAGSGTISASRDGFTVEIVDSEHHSNGISLYADITFPDTIPVVGGLDNLSLQSTELIYTTNRGESRIPVNYSLTESQDAETNTVRYHFVFNLQSNAPADSHFTLALKFYQLEDPIELSWQADVDDAKTYTAKSGDSKVTLTISPYVINVEFTNSDYNTISDLYDSITIWGKDGTMLPVKGSYGGSSGSGLLRLHITRNTPVDIDNIRTVKVGGLILE